MSEPVVQIDHLTYAYGQRIAVDDLSLNVDRGEIFGFLGPNGSGKTTLFRILATLILPPPGRVRILGLDPVEQLERVRSRIGVVFQSPSLDKQLTAEENLLQQGRLYGLRGKELRARVAVALESVRLAERARDRVGRYSGGMRRRVEVVKGLLHHPELLLLDEPSTGLDPAARIDLWQQLHRINREDGVSILLTTHLMEEADRCTRLAIVAAGKLLACDTPAALKERIGGDVITLSTSRPAEVRRLLREKLDVEVQEINSTLRLERPRGHEFVPQLIEALPGLVDSVSVGKPTLEDVFVQLTGRKLNEEVAMEN